MTFMQPYAPIIPRWKLLEKFHSWHRFRQIAQALLNLYIDARQPRESENIPETYPILLNVILSIAPHL